MFTEGYLQTAAMLVNSYAGPEPFHLYLKKYFGEHKKFGARDRRVITQLCYAWFRTVNALQTQPQRQQFIYGFFLCTFAPSPFLQAVDAALNEAVGQPLPEKILLLKTKYGVTLEPAFAWRRELSAAVDAPAFVQSFFLQPAVFLRLRPGQEAAVTAKLVAAGMGFLKSSPTTLALQSAEKLAAVLHLDYEAVVQDKSSQQALGLLQEHGLLKNASVWDCCAGSGGKALLLADLFSYGRLLVSDVRASILHNLEKRFAAADITNYRSLVLDAAAAAPPHNQIFDLIICDAPCTGSGTWSRTPEQLQLFSADKILFYASLQQRIVANVQRYLKPGGLLLYITCSVFEKENEGLIAAAGKQLTFLKSAYYAGYRQRADTLFAALFQKS